MGGTFGRPEGSGVERVRCWGVETCTTRFVLVGPNEGDKCKFSRKTHLRPHIDVYSCSVHVGTAAPKRVFFIVQALLAIRRPGTCTP